MERAYPEEMDLKKGLLTPRTDAGDQTLFAHNGYWYGILFSISVYGEGKPCRLSPIWPAIFDQFSEARQKGFHRQDL